MKEDVFLDALRDDPTDEVTWLALADWLDEDGQPLRAELVRLTRQLRAMPVGERGDLPARVTELLDDGVRPVIVEQTNSIGMRFALVPPGAFLMGSPPDEEGRREHEQQHEVEITRPYWMGVFLVTQAQWRAVMGNNPSFFCKGNDGELRIGDLDTDDFPVEEVSWEAAKEFVARLGALPAEQERGRIYRLPTEAEWERACRGFGAYRAYHFGNDASAEHLNFAGSGLGRTCKVGSYRPNEFGLYDLHGNVWEWCLDAFSDDFYANCSRQDPCNERYRRTTSRSIRGGAYFGQCRSASREGWSNVFTYSDLGLRAALVASRRG